RVTRPGGRDRAVERHARRVTQRNVRWRGVEQRSGRKYSSRDRRWLSGECPKIGVSTCIGRLQLSGHTLFHFSTYPLTFPLFHFSTFPLARAARSVLVLGVEPRVLVEEGERLEGRHAIEEQHAVEVIGLVLRDARGKTLERQLDGAAGAIERADDDVRVAGYH